MIFRPRRPGWLPMAGLALVLVSILAFLFAKTREHDAGYFESVALLRQLKQLDSRWELDVLKARMGIDTSYDSLVDPLSELNDVREKLRTTVAAQPAAAASLVSATASFGKSVAEKTRLIEQFKSHNSVLRNSLAFLPTAVDDLQDAINKADDGDRAASGIVLLRANKVLLDGLVYSQAPTDERAADIQARLNAFAGAKIPAGVKTAVDIFSSHVRTVLREQPLVNSLLSSIDAVPVAVRIDDLDRILSGQQLEAEMEAQRFRRYLLIFAAALMCLLLYATVNLIGSHAVIKGVNRQLQVANSTLEQRVQERTGELHEAQSELVTTARRAGMAEIANNVLHNVGNVLNSVNISATLVGGTMRNSKAQGFGKAIGLMNDHSADLGAFLTLDAKGQVLLGYLNKLVSALAAEQQGVMDELGSLTKSIDHIKDIVATQQSYAGATSVIEAVRINELMEDALRINATGLVRQQVVTTREFAAMPPLLLDKHLVLQIMVNLIGNVCQAMESLPDRTHRMTLRTEVYGQSRERQLRISVADNGEGIVPQNLEQLFVHGFTTRKTGHGFGLHSSALAAREMGGTLIAQSGGAGLGATFTLELPVKDIEELQ